MDHGSTWSRRKFSKAIVSAQLLLASGILSIPLSCADEKTPETTSLLNDAETKTLGLAMDRIIPANSTMPSASEVGAVAYVMAILKDLPDIGPLFKELLVKIEGISQLLFNSDYAGLSASDRTSVLKDLESKHAELFGVLKDFTYEAYYTNESVFPLIGYEPHPTQTLGPNMEPFDPGILNRVKQMPPFYTKI
jgi:hypothetical protein